MLQRLSLERFIVGRLVGRSQDMRALFWTSAGKELNYGSYQMEVFTSVVLYGRMMHVLLLGRAEVWKSCAPGTLLTLSMDHSAEATRHISAMSRIGCYLRPVSTPRVPGTSLEHLLRIVAFRMGRVIYTVSLFALVSAGIASAD